MYCDQWTRSCASSSARMCFPIDARICRLVAPTPISKSAINKKAEGSLVGTLARTCAPCRTSQPSGKRPSRNESKAPGCSVSEVWPGFEGDRVTRRLPLDVQHTHSRPNSSLKHERHQPLGPPHVGGVFARELPGHQPILLSHPPRKQRTEHDEKDDPGATAGDR